MIKLERETHDGYLLVFWVSDICIDTWGRLIGKCGLGVYGLKLNESVSCGSIDTSPISLKLQI